VAVTELPLKNTPYKALFSLTTLYISLAHLEAKKLQKKTDGKLLPLESFEGIGFKR